MALTFFPSGKIEALVKTWISRLIKGLVISYYPLVK